jgi:hypothetical protein
VDLASVQACVTAASTSGVNTITISPANGSATWAGTVALPSTKKIILNGNGATIAGTGTVITMNSSPTVQQRVTGFTFTGTFNGSVGGAVQTNGVPGDAISRVDHNTLTVTAGGSTMLEIGDNAGLLVDHNTFNAPDNSEMIHNYGTGNPASNAGWQDNLVPGSATQMVYIEDNTFFNTDQSSPNFNACSGVQAYYGARTVMRHNTFNYCQVDEHGTAGAIGVRWWEISNNNFVIPAGGGNQCCYIVVRAGTGVIFSNTKSGGTNTNGTGAIQLVEEDSGSWPLAYQIGSGLNGYTNGHTNCTTTNSNPAYLWDTQAGFSVSPSTNVVLNRDFFSSASQPATLERFETFTDTICSTTYSYSPFTYPYPLDANLLPNPGGVPAPTGLTVTVH